MVDLCEKIIKNWGAKDTAPQSINPSLRLFVNKPLSRDHWISTAVTAANYFR